MTKNDKLPLILLAIVLLVAVSQIQVGDFILYQGVILKNATISNETGEVWTLGLDRCVRQSENMIILESGLLIPPENFYMTEIECKHAFNLIKEPAEPKISCYYVENDLCILEQFDEVCPSQYFQSLSECEMSLVDLSYSAKRLFSERKTWIMMGIGAVALLFMGIGALRKR